VIASLLVGSLLIGFGIFNLIGGPKAYPEEGGS
jgi:hypothetical protein